jgi:hypothetical protein
VTTTGDLLVAASFGARTIDPEGRYTRSFRAAGDDDALFIRLDSMGNLRWVTPAGGLGDDEGNDIGDASDGYTWASGHYVGPALFGAGSTPIILHSGTDGAGFVARLAP